MNPVKDVPRALVISMSGIIVLFSLFVFFVSGVGNLSQTNNDGNTAVVDVF